MQDDHNYSASNKEVSYNITPLFANAFQFTIMGMGLRFLAFALELAFNSLGNS